MSKPEASFYRRHMTTQRMHFVQTPARADGIESVPTVIIGGGQAGLVMGYHLQQAGERFVILDSQPRIGDTWRNRWDSLRLFSFPKYSSLPGWRIPVSSFPTHNEMADYLEAYAHRFNLPVRSGVRATWLSRNGDGFRLSTTHGELRCDRVVIATGGFQTPIVPEFAAELTPEIGQLHSSAYRNPEQLEGKVLVVGAGNSGAEIALDAVKSGHPTWLSGRHPGQVPFRIETRKARFLVPIVMFAFRRVLTLDTPMGRKMQQPAIEHGTPLVRTKQSDLEAAGVQRVGRIADVRDGRPVTVDGDVLDPQTVVWCTGYRPDYSWIDLPVSDASGHPIMERGVSPVTGLYFIGLEFQYAAASATIQGLDQDARYLLRAMAKRGSTRQVPVHERAAA
jgi:putative flavoprotein involved in K+ transport